MSKVPMSIRDRLSLTMEGKLQWKVCLHRDVVQGWVRPVEKGCNYRCIFFSLTDET